MCGICGYISKKKYDTSVICDMRDTMQHRGPNDAGEQLLELRGGQQLALGHRRLSIFDLSSAGHQPMMSEDDRFCIVFNGEIYNHKELRSELEKRGYHFTSQCDTEVLLYMYAEYGKRCFSMLNGMWGVAIWDRVEEKLVLSRDRMGKKPLYFYYPSNRTIFMFGSELKPIIKHPEFKKNILTNRISEYLTLNSIASPSTIFEDTYKVEPGQIVIWSPDGISKELYWSVADEYKSLQKQKETGKLPEKYEYDGYKDAQKKLEELLLDAVSLRLAADVPVGTFLSGGIDSSLITALAQSVTGNPVKTFTIGFFEKERNEAVYSKEIAKHLGTEHTELYVGNEELLSQIKDLAIYYDEPFSDSSQIPSMLVSKLAKEQTTVTLSGDGGDELFCGYEKYDWMKWVQRLDSMGDIAYSMCNSKALREYGLEKKLGLKAEALINNRNPIYKVQLFNEPREKYAKELVLGDSASSKYDFEKELSEICGLYKNWQMRNQLLDMRYYMADEVLVKMDRASMKNSLEVRCPILDYRIVDFSMCLPQEYKYRTGNKKRILKDITYKYIPSKLLDRPKMGFGVPLRKWLLNDLKALLKQYSDEEIVRRQGIFDYNKLVGLKNALEKSNSFIYRGIVWGFLVFQIWYQEYVEDLWGC